MKYVLIACIVFVLLICDFSAQSHSVQSVNQAPCYQTLEQTFNDMYRDTQHIKKAQLSHTTFPLKNGKNDN